MGEGQGRRRTFPPPPSGTVSEPLGLITCPLGDGTRWVTTDDRRRPSVILLLGVCTLRV